VADAKLPRARHRGAWGVGQRRAGRAEHPGHQGHRRLHHLLHRPLARQGGASASEIGNIGFYDVDFEPLPGGTAPPPSTPRAMA
jgi:4-hydroxyphenylpyruvate dioxygenase